MQAAQVIHAAGESARLAQHLPPGAHAVALVASPEELDALRSTLDACGARYAAIVENDTPYAGQLVALGVEPQSRAPALRRLFSHLRLAGSREERRKRA